ncbi:MAG: acetate--CoA ligase family protein [Spirochaetes bacterium]|nr:acetate--CoA ligase family protein [Spirochaetota bacterium]
MAENPLHRLMNPGSIATVGAGNNILKMGTMHALSIINDGYRGKIFPVHPHQNTVLGLDAYRSIADIPEVPDLAFIVVPSVEVIKIIEEFGKKGTKSAVIITAGFGEMNEDGRLMQDRLNELSGQYGIRFLGPNCMGIINSQISLNTTVMPYTSAPGSLGFASQSGTYVTQTIPYLERNGIRFSKAISVGNSANIDIIDALEYLGEDEQTRAVSLYIEGIRDVERFIDVARAITPHKPVLAQYVGGSSAGARSSLSHTGSMAAPDHLYDGLFRQAGIIRVESIEDLYRNGNMLANQPCLNGKRIGILTNSGGPGSAIANALERGGLDVPEFSKEVQDQVRPLVPPHAPCGNPVDMTFSMDIENLSNKIPEIILKSGEVDGIVIHGVMGTGWLKAVFPHFNSVMKDVTLEGLLAGFSDKSGSAADYIPVYNKPVSISSFIDREDNYTASYHDHGVPVFDSPEKAAGGMIMMMRHREIRERKPWTRPASVPAPAGAVRILEQCSAKGQANLDEHGSKLFLKEWGIPVTEEIVAATEEEAATAAEKAGYPLVMKASAGDILHKTGRGLIHLDLKSKDEAVASFRKIQQAAGRSVPVIAYRMVSGEREFVAGLVRAPGFVPSVMFGLGGVFTEALNDAVFRPAPISEDDATEMLFDIRARALLGAFRGMPAVHVEALAKVLHRLSLIPIAHPEVAEIDLNPIIIDGSEPVAVDALVVLK